MVAGPMALHLSLRSAAKEWLEGPVACSQGPQRPCRDGFGHPWGRTGFGGLGGNATEAALAPGSHSVKLEGGCIGRGGLACVWVKMASGHNAIKPMDGRAHVALPVQVLTLGDSIRPLNSCRIHLSATAGTMLHFSTITQGVALGDRERRMSSLLPIDCLKEAAQALRSRR